MLRMLLGIFLVRVRYMPKSKIRQYGKIFTKNEANRSIEAYISNSTRSEIRRTAKVRVPMSYVGSILQKQK